jgi:hypothetical protein
MPSGYGARVKAARRKDDSSTLQIQLPVAAYDALARMAGAQGVSLRQCAMRLLVAALEQKTGQAE